MKKIGIIGIILICVGAPLAIIGGIYLAMGFNINISMPYEEFKAAMEKQSIGGFMLIPGIAALFFGVCLTKMGRRFTGVLTFKSGEQPAIKGGKYCPHCGSMNEGDSVFCTKCSKSL